MATEIDARYTEDGKLVFNVWNTIAGEYDFIEPLTPEQLKDHMLSNALLEAVKKFDRDFPERVLRAIQTGTSRRRGLQRTNFLNAPWRGVEDDDEEEEDEG